MDKVRIETPAIELGQFLKWAGLVETGGHARFVINNGEVSVNGQLETRHGRRLMYGDEVTYAGKQYLIAAEGGDS